MRAFAVVLLLLAPLAAMAPADALVGAAGRCLAAAGATCTFSCEDGDRVSLTANGPAELHCGGASIFCIEDFLLCSFAVCCVQAGTGTCVSLETTAVVYCEAS